MKKLLFIPLLALSGCGISTYQSETLKETTYVPLSVKEQILGYTHGTCAAGTLRQRHFIGALATLDNQDVYVYQYKLVHNLDETYAIRTRIFKNEIEEASPPVQTGTFEVTGESVTLENIGPAKVELGYSASKIYFEIQTPEGPRTASLRTMWSENDITESPLCP